MRKTFHHSIQMPKGNFNIYIETAKIVSCCYIDKQEFIKIGILWTSEKKS